MGLYRRFEKTARYLTPCITRFIHLTHTLILVQWSAWLTHTRQHPPTIEVCSLYMNKQPGWILLILISCRNCKRICNDDNEF